MNWIDFTPFYNEADRLNLTTSLRILSVRSRSDIGSKLGDNRPNLDR